MMVFALQLLMLLTRGKFKARCSYAFSAVQLCRAIAFLASPYLPTDPSCLISPSLPAPQKTAISLSLSEVISIVIATVSCKTSIMGLLFLCLWWRKHKNRITPSNIIPNSTLLKDTALHSSNSACPSSPVQHTEPKTTL